ncbi:16720_t:CDS:2 [Funneliformis mosseae]|uniref:Proteasome subunit beta n=1 Tax=Funneliformis mosseae TaxID=27381 RepID=A0A9N9GLG5_FUNMO|nr:16720_t:CDS:2 [Funneliformis mosseae]
MDYNGGTVLAMAGKNCVVVGSDKRLGVQNLTVSTEFQKVFPVTEKCYIALPGLATDVQTLSELFRLKCNMYKLREEREIEPLTLANMISSTLYGRRFGPYFCEPIIAGLDKNNKPHIYGMDLIGCLNYPDDFTVAGCAEAALFGMCESLWEPDLEPDELFETASQALLSAADRNSLVGWGAVIHTM